jgi:proton-translocating NADH-quinone oxidoreductase chain N
MSGNLQTVLPLITLTMGAFGIYLLVRLCKLNNQINALLTATMLIISFIQLILLVLNMDLGMPFFGVLGNEGIIYQPDVIGVFISAAGVIIGILITIYSGETLKRDPRHGLYYPLILLSITGLMGMFFTKDLFNLFLVSELSNITASALIAFQMGQKSSVKAGFKYLIMSSLGTMIMLLGIYFTYHGTGTTNLSEIEAVVNNLTRIGAACFLVGFSIKAGVVPLHTWVPQVYSQAPSAISGLLAGVLSKSMLFIMSIISLKLGLTASELGIYLIAFGCINMLLGSIRALTQGHIKRFLAYSSIAHTGYLMFTLGIGFYYQLESAFSATLFLFIVIAFAKSLAFLSSGVYEHVLGTADSHALSPMNKNLRGTPVLLSLALAGLAGIPPLAGFTSKWMVFSSAINVGDGIAFVGLGIFLVSTVIGLGGYLPMIARQFQSQDDKEGIGDKGENQSRPSIWLTLPIWALSAIFLFIGFFPAPWLTLIQWMINWVALL